MNILKETVAGEHAALSAGDLDQIAALAQRPLSQEEIFTFSVRLCDNEIDRDFERFPTRTLEELAPLFVGKCGIFDHQWSARGQTARIYKTEIVREPRRLTLAGEPCCWLKGYAYMMRTSSNLDLIAEIEGGIKKEVSVGCSVKHAVCSICGADRSCSDCGHEKGTRYGGQLCYASLEGAEDAYEFSFVAVPAQPLAGVVKHAHPSTHAPLLRLEEEAALGRSCLKFLREEAVRLALLADQELDAAAMKSLAEKLSPQELEELRKSFARRAEEKFPVHTQLSYHGKTTPSAQQDSAFLV